MNFFRIWGMLFLVMFLSVGCRSKPAPQPGDDPSWNKFAAATNDAFWWILPDQSASEAKLESWPIPEGVPVKLEVLTTMGLSGVKIVEGVEYALTFQADAEGIFHSLQKVETSQYRDLWETTITVYEAEPFIRFRFNVNTPEQFIDFGSVEIAFQ